MNYRDLAITKALCNSGGGGGVSSWNDLTDKPFGTEKVTVDPTFNGDLTGKTFIEFQDGIYFVKITDYTPSEAECIGATIEMKVYSVNPTFDVIGTVDSSAQFYGIPSFMPVIEGSEGSPVVIVTETTTLNVIEVTAGTYFMVIEEDGTIVSYPTYFSSLDVGTVEIVRKVPSEYLPGLPMINLVSMGMPAVAIGAGQSIENSGVEILIEFMKKGTFRYTALFEVAEGMTISFTATVNSFCSNDSGMYQATALAYFDGTPLLLNLWATVGGNITLQVVPLS